MSLHYAGSIFGNHQRRQQDTHIILLVKRVTVETTMRRCGHLGLAFRIIQLTAIVTGISLFRVFQHAGMITGTGATIGRRDTSSILGEILCSRHNQQTGMGIGMDMTEAPDAGKRILIARHPLSVLIVRSQLYHSVGHRGIRSQHPSGVGCAYKQIHIVQYAFRRFALGTIPVYRQ